MRNSIRALVVALAIALILPAAVSADWPVANRTMVNEAGGTLPGLALRRVRGKPHLVTEYNHPAPADHIGTFSVNL